MSFPALAQLIVDKRQYDFIYVDGSHNADDALADAVMCFGLLRPVVSCCLTTTCGKMISTIWVVATKYRRIRKHVLSQAQTGLGKLSVGNS
jgi:hypothetical protein